MTSAAHRRLWPRGLFGWVVAFVTWPRRLSLAIELRDRAMERNRRQREAVRQARHDALHARSQMVALRLQLIRSQQG